MNHLKQLNMRVSLGKHQRLSIYADPFEGAFTKRFTLTMIPPKDACKIWRIVLTPDALRGRQFLERPKSSEGAKTILHATFPLRKDLPRGAKRPELFAICDGESTLNIDGSITIKLPEVLPPFIGNVRHKQRVKPEAPMNLEGAVNFINESARTVPGFKMEVNENRLQVMIVQYFGS